MFGSAPCVHVVRHGTRLLCGLYVLYWWGTRDTSCEVEEVQAPSRFASQLQAEIISAVCPHSTLQPFD